MATTTRITQAGALKLAVGKFGKVACVQDRGRAEVTTPESRAIASAALKEHRTQKPRTRGTPEWTAWKERHDELFIGATHRRYRVGELIWGGACFCIRGEGDTWAEALEKAGCIKP